MLKQAFHPDTIRMFIEYNIAELAHPHLDPQVRRNLTDENFKWFEMLIQKERRTEAVINQRQMAA